MRKNIHILSIFLLALFVVTNTGVPLLLHTCNMNGDVSFEKCDMCKSEASAGKVNDCCASKEKSAESIFSHTPECCTSQLLMPHFDGVYSLNDTFNSKSESESFQQPLISNCIVDLVFPLPILSPEQNSPPGLKPSQPIYIQNSTFLI